MKKTKGILAIGILSTLIVAGAYTTTSCEMVGLTIGYWKNHTGRWPCEIDTTFGDVFDVPSTYENLKLIDALNYRGKDATYLFLKQAAAAYLNIHAIGYPITHAELQAIITRNLDPSGVNYGDRGAILEDKDILDGYNNLGFD